MQSFHRVCGAEISQREQVRISALRASLALALNQFDQSQNYSRDTERGVLVTSKLVARAERETSAPTEAAQIQRRMGM